MVILIQDGKTRKTNDDNQDKATTICFESKHLLSAIAQGLSDIKIEIIFLI
jgi:hypothetical protein